ncbi:cardiolipin synthase [Paenibacillus sp. FSL M7-1455]|uniref:Cardiolipin synthase n=1 Tax=Paenibacillus cookii TaxID=157839 RepID=A0ABQ4LWD0_9BACL|nr:cardiolipin synthase [Paenibacillus cookii]GIO67514.1 cardiolipin synthase [Paenibacillus cookii]HWO53956.1 cardiolipin synthase [Paenibacillus cookii]
MRRAIQAVLIAALLFVFYYVGFGFFGKTAGTIVSIFSTLTVVSLGFMIFMENRNPSSTMAWILLLALVPVVGLFFYLLFGQNYFKRRKFDKKAEQDSKIYEMLEEGSVRVQQDLSDLNPMQQQLLRLSQRLARTPISFSSETRILTNGKETFSTLLQELEKAKHHIHMEYYIYRADDIGTRIQRILIEKAKAGVHVRFMYDAWGSMQLPKSFLREMANAGVKVAAYGSSKAFFLSRVNFRNHRKIVVIDGNVGFIGGLNVGDEYLSRNATYGFWRDTHMSVKGEAVRTLQIIFLQDWNYMTGEQVLEAEYLSPLLAERNSGAVQIIPSGPDNDRRALKNIFFSMITSAQKSVWLATPYFIPDEDILTSLRVAAMSGLDVRILFPAKPDKWLPFLASHSYFPALLDVGVQIYEYEKGFLHSKLLIIDGEVATIGTANMDMRSFHLNFEVNALLVQTESVKRIVSDFERDLKSTKQIVMDKFMKKKIPERILESLARLMSPLL